MRISPTSKPLVYITMGDPAGIAPEVIMKTMASPGISGLAIFVLVADRDVMETAASDAGYRGRFLFHGRSLDLSADIERDGVVHLVDPGPPVAKNSPGIPSREGAVKTLECLRHAVRLLRGSPADRPGALVTGPLSKESIAGICPGFVGHTEYLRDAYSVDMVTMALVGEKLRVVPATRHIPIKDVPVSLTERMLLGTLKQVSDNSYVVCGKEDPVIGVCALNPHCGENGRIGTEEIEVIRPAVEKAKAFCKGVIGPVSADVVFYKALKGDIDIVVSMYHDQALAPFKMVDFETGVNMTLGLGDVRTSPDHGTAFDIAGKGIADPRSMEQAVRVAVESAARKHMMERRH